MAPVIHELKRRNIPHSICITAQHREMLDSVLDFFEIIPDYDLDLMTKNQNLNKLSASILREFDSVIEKENPEIVLVQGDTTTALMASIAAFHRGIKIGHIEAGLRTYNLKAPYPEEANRQIISKITDFHFTPTEKASQNLLSGIIETNKIVNTGNTIVDALLYGKSKLNSSFRSQVISDIEKRINLDKKLILVTGHRRENFGSGMGQLCEALEHLALNEDIEVIFPVHLNPNVQETVLKKLQGIENIHLFEPVDYPVFIWLLSISQMVISDSGGIQEEAPSFNIPVIVTREVSERMEGVEAGIAYLTGMSSEAIIETAKSLLNKKKKDSIVGNPYGDGRASKRIVDYLINRLNE
jgi:UDP-N-acetylglucosamine 2-epimerase (non-hydrolysing)